MSLSVACLIALTGALGCDGENDQSESAGRERPTNVEAASVGEPPTVAPAPVEGVDARPPSPTVIASGQTARGDPFELVLYGTSEGPCIMTLFPGRRASEGGGRCAEGLLPRLSTPIQAVGSSRTGQHVVSLDGFVSSEVRSVRLEFELEGESQTLDAVTEQLDPGLVRKAGGRAPLGVFIAFPPEGVTPDTAVTATAYDGEGNPLGTTTWSSLDETESTP